MSRKINGLLLTGLLAVSIVLPVCAINVQEKKEKPKIEQVIVAQAKQLCIKAKDVVLGARKVVVGFASVAAIVVGAYLMRGQSTDSDSGNGGYYDSSDGDSGSGNDDNVDGQAARLAGERAQAQAEAHRRFIRVMEQRLGQPYPGGRFARDEQDGLARERAQAQADRDRQARLARERDGQEWLRKYQAQNAARLQREEQARREENQQRARRIADFWQGLRALDQAGQEGLPPSYDQAVAGVAAGAAGAAGAAEDDGPPPYIRLDQARAEWPPLQWD